jgi:CRISPR system Cascade subunit CasC
LDKLVDGLIERTKNRAGAPDIALFGRMLADRPETNIDAACQVAHAISTHAIKMDTDFFTAVEELLEPDETGAAMMDIAGFNCACFYRYARLDWEQLTKNLAGDTDLARRTAEAFLRASEAAMPTGKKSSHDNYTRPVFMLAVVRKEHSAGWSLVNAFEKPVRTWGGLGLVEPSVLALDHYWNDLCRFYGTQTVKAVAVALHPTFKPKELSETLQSAIKPGSADKSGMDTWVEAILDELQE